MHPINIPPMLNSHTQVINGVFLGRSFSSTFMNTDKKIVNWQKIILEIDQWVANEQNIGLMAKDVFFLSIGNNSKEFHGCYRQLYGPKNRFSDHVQNNLDGWEAYVVNMDKGTLQGHLRSFSWIWSENVLVDCKESNILRFTKL